MAEFWEMQEEEAHFHYVMNDMVGAIKEFGVGFVMDQILRDEEMTEEFIHWAKEYLKNVQ